MAFKDKEGDGKDDGELSTRAVLLEASKTDPLRLYGSGARPLSRLTGFGSCHNFMGLSAWIVIA